MIIGIDEVGRGCWAGPLVAGAVALDRPVHGLADSKTLSPKKREALVKIIRLESAAIGLGWVFPEELDQIGLSQSIKIAMHRAFEQLPINFDELIVDGNINYFPDEPKATAVIKADALIHAVSAASIIAKVARDKWMIYKAAKKFPGYGFDNHVGYGTVQHAEALRMHGLCILHRRSFKPIKEFL
jgi:ribonuclease HII